MDACSSGDTVPGSHMDACSSDDPVRASTPTAAMLTAYEREGFVVVDALLDAETCATLNAQLEAVLRGRCNGRFGGADKAPKRWIEPRCKPGKAPPPLGGASRQTLQWVNIWKADADFARVVLSPALGKLVAELGGWEDGARIANDQVWAKPPGGAPLTFHRDSAYLDMLPDDVITVWIALDDLDPTLGPLQYVHGA